ncbi:hypothetical protein ACQZ61_04090 [Agrobacterium vitis]|uniref:Uncharacterized protein n=1 Tax=Allorhizobium ampelinum (strain ATCC BAA-846 / DSM 112012 / S4) TaxID=311402 RepID=B9K2T0_ALLAM|nr:MULTISPECIES: hypothetical protein [Rhizobium/Agrobacterium group]ACM39178.1 hypothetical protein Avi_6194 [Allorhizobium ampelinum S4]MCF1452296.1 gene transfer agent family protein [Agrobacterium vitis]MUO27190.1 hypothetical protein [Agrobacterium vitis]MVA47327.1 hypothetical protein [Agrobacterium vitis]
MSNPIRGTITRSINGEQMEFRLAANEWCELEEELGKPMGAILREFAERVQNETISMAFLRSIFRAALCRCKPGLTHDAAGEIMSSIDLKDAATIIGETINASMPKAAAEKDGAPGKSRAARTKNPSR